MKLVTSMVTVSSGPQQRACMLSEMGNGGSGMPAITVFASPVKHSGPNEPSTGRPSSGLFWPAGALMGPTMKPFGSSTEVEL